MRDCSHHIKDKNPAWSMFQRFIQSQKGAEWLEKALESQKKIDEEKQKESHD